MTIEEITQRLEKIANYAVYPHEKPLIISLDDGIAIHEAINLLKRFENERRYSMEGPCPYPCHNKSYDGYCLTTGCINPHYQYIVFFNNCNNEYPSPCKNCPNNPSNGGTGICHCILGCPTITY